MSISKIKLAIKVNKYFNDSKYYKTNVWSNAHHSSSAAMGKAGGCSTCKANHYNATLVNKRATTKRHGSRNHCKDVSNKFCSECKSKIEEIIGVVFGNRYAP